MAETVRGVRGRRRWVWGAGAAAVALVVGGAAVVALSGSDEACGCVDPDAGLDVGYGMLGPGHGVHSRVEVVEVAAVDGYTRTVLRYSHWGEGEEAFDPEYFAGGAEAGDGFRIWDPATGRLYGNQPGLGTVTGEDAVWEPGTRYEIVLFSAPLEPGTEEVEVRGPHGELRIRKVDVRGGAGDTEPLWTPHDGQDAPAEGGEEEFETVPLSFTAPSPGAEVPGYTEVFASSAPEPVDPVPAAAEADEEGRAVVEVEGRTWFMSARRYEVEDGVLTVDYRLEVDSRPESEPGNRPDLFPEGFTLIDPATGAVVPELRVGDPEGESEPLWSVPWPQVTRHPRVIFGELHFAVPEGEVGDLLLDAGVFGALPVEPRA